VRIIDKIPVQDLVAEFYLTKVKKSLSTGSDNAS